MNVAQTFGNAAGGAAAGSAIAPGIGTAIGAGIGLLSGLLGGDPSQPLQTKTVAPVAPGQFQQIAAPDMQSRNSQPLQFAAQGGVINGPNNTPGDSPANDVVPVMLSGGETVIPKTIAHDPHLAALFASEQAHQIQNSFNNALGFAHGGVVPGYAFGTPPGGVPNPNPSSPMLDMMRGVAQQQPFISPAGQGVGMNTNGPTSLQDVLNSLMPGPGAAAPQPGANVADNGKPIAASKSVSKAAKAQAKAVPANPTDTNTTGTAALAAPSNTTTPPQPQDSVAAKDEGKLLGLSAGQWQGVGVATGILAKLFERNQQVLQTKDIHGPQMPQIQQIQAPARRHG